MIEPQQIGLAEHEVAGRAVGLRPASPGHHAVVAGVGDEDHVRRRRRRACGQRMPSAPAPSPGVLVARREIALPEHEIGRRAVACREFRSRRARADCRYRRRSDGRRRWRRRSTSSAYRRARRRTPRLASAGAKVGLAEHDVGGPVRGVGIAAPEQHAMVPGVGDREHAVGRADAGRHIERRRRRSRLWRCGLRARSPAGRSENRRAHGPSSGARFQISSR